jgi:hypothetical protein
MRGPGLVSEHGQVQRAVLNCSRPPNQLILAPSAIGGVDLIVAQPGTYVIFRSGRGHGCVGVNTKI